LDGYGAFGRFHAGAGKHTRQIRPTSRHEPWGEDHLRFADHLLVDQSRLTLPSNLRGESLLTSELGEAQIFLAVAAKSITFGF